MCRCPVACCSCVRWTVIHGSDTQGSTEVKNGTCLFGLDPSGFVSLTFTPYPFLLRTAVVEGVEPGIRSAGSVQVLQLCRFTSGYQFFTCKEKGAGRDQMKSFNCLQGSEKWWHEGGWSGLRANALVRWPQVCDECEDLSHQGATTQPHWRECGGPAWLGFPVFWVKKKKSYPFWGVFVIVVDSFNVKSLDFFLLTVVWRTDNFLIRCRPTDLDLAHRSPSWGLFLNVMIHYIFIHYFFCLFSPASFPILYFSLIYLYYICLLIKFKKTFIKFPPCIRSY